MLQRHTELAQEHKHNDLFLRILFRNDQFQQDSSDISIDSQEIETTRNMSRSSISRISSEELTIIQNNSATSHKMSDDSSVSFDSVDSSEYLHSTQISNTKSNQILLIESLINKSTQCINGVNPSHACTHDYENTFTGDLTVSFGDSVEVLRDDNDEWAFVQRTSDGCKGFVPREILLELDKYVSKLKLHRDISYSVTV